MWEGRAVHFILHLVLEKVMAMIRNEFGCLPSMIVKNG